MLRIVWPQSVRESSHVCLCPHTLSSDWWFSHKIVSHPASGKRNTHMYAYACINVCDVCVWAVKDTGHRCTSPQQMFEKWSLSWASVPSTARELGNNICTFVWLFNMDQWIPERKMLGETWPLTTLTKSIVSFLCHTFVSLLYLTSTLYTHLCAETTDICSYAKRHFCVWKAKCDLHFLITQEEHKIDNRQNVIKICKIEASSFLAVVIAWEL